MAKKKKKKKGSLNDEPARAATNLHSPSFATFGVVPTASSPLLQPPTAQLSASDAASLELRLQDELILVGTDSLAILPVSIKHHQRVSSSGTVHVPSGLFECLFASKCQQERNVEQTPTQATPQTLSTPSPMVVSTPPSSSGFSFRDSTSKTTPHSTPKNPPHKGIRQTASAIVASSVLGQAIYTSVVTVAQSVAIQLDPSAVTVAVSSNATVQRIMRAQLLHQYLQPLQTCRLSMAGKATVTTIVKIHGEEPVESELELLSNDELDLFHDALDLDVILYRLEESTHIEIVADNHNENNNELHIEPTKSPLQPQVFVAGLDATLKEVHSLLHPPLFQADLFRQHHIPIPKGILLHGSSGVGKSCLAKQIAAEYAAPPHNVKVQYVHCSAIQSQSMHVGEAERHLQALFENTQLLILDDIHLICPKRGSIESSSSVDRVASTLLALMDGVKERSVLIMALTSHPSALDPALRRPGRLDTEVEVPLPDEASTRAQILKFHTSKLVENCRVDFDFLQLAKLAKGFNGADCMLAVKEAIRLSILADLTLNDTHFRQAIRSIKPSAIKSVTVEIPQVKWSDIGGMDTVKRDLREAIELPLQHSETFEKLNVPPPRGILLYGPPGCSKTLMARALATEGQMNFLAVKGPELLSKWLGESERALASLFRRARMASPSIIFFDEMDAIASRRGNSSNSSGRLLSQLLTELDGVTHTSSHSQAKKQRVVVVGATNRPDLLDRALLRPGRMDRMIYVGVPDPKSREMILSLSLKDKLCGDDIDISRLASDELTRGFSGAEMVAICRDGALIALEESDNLTSQDLPKIEMRHLLSAIEGMQRQITPEMIRFYQEFRTGQRS